tara:strand:- start:240 stop:821 length:582 start_codon:yes stop_codon:yes gene_type:complete
MNSKSLIQISLIFLIITICGSLYYKYLYKKPSFLNQKNITISEKTKKEVLGNVVKDIEYKSENEQGNSYIIKSNKGEFKDNNSNVIFMTNVTAVIKLKDKTIINLTSLNANYNILDNNTNFFNNVSLNYLNHDITADNIDVFFKDSKVEAYNNLVYRNLDLSLIADKVEINLITKNSKVFMLNDEKIKIFKSN